MDFENATIDSIREFGHNLGVEMVEFMNPRDILSAVDDPADDVSEIIAEHAQDGFENYKSFTPFEFYAHAINEREDSEDCWNALEEGFSEGVESATPKLLSNVKEELEQTELRQFIEIPRWINSDIDLAQVWGIVQGGCESGAYMPAVTYHEALQTMGDHGDEVFDYIVDATGELPSIPDHVDSWAGMAVFFLSVAVELWAAGAESELEPLLNQLGD